MHPHACPRSRAGCEVQEAGHLDLFAASGHWPGRDPFPCRPRSSGLRRAPGHCRPVPNVLRGPETLVGELRVEHGVVDRPEMAFRANLGVDRAALVDPLPDRSSRRDRRGKSVMAISAMSARQSPLAFAQRDPGRAASSRCWQIFHVDRGAEQRIRRVVGRKIDQRGDAERLAGIANKRLPDRGVVLRPPEPRHGPDRREADRRIVARAGSFQAR